MHGHYAQPGSRLDFTAGYSVEKFVAFLLFSALKHLHFTAMGRIVAHRGIKMRALGTECVLRSRAGCADTLARPTV
jgi:hypothetical protein